MARTVFVFQPPEEDVFVIPSAPFQLPHILGSG